MFTMAPTHTVSSESTRSLNIFGKPLSIFGVPVNRETIFADHNGNYKSRIEKRQRKLIVKTTFIKFFLHHDERIHCLTTGYSPVSVTEQLLTGIAFLFFKRAIFVFTEKRILHVPTRFDRSNLGAVSQILYEDCAHIEMKGGNLLVKYKNGTQELFPYIARRERKKIRALLANIELKPKEAGRLKARVRLCPSCTNVLDPKIYACPSCKLPFRSAPQAVIRALLIPGGGYFYSRHSFLGIVIGLLEIALLAKVLFDWIAFGQNIDVNLAMLAALTGALVALKAICAFHSRQLIRFFIPTPNDFAMRKV